jgi:hypothetical protein
VPTRKLFETTLKPPRILGYEHLLAYDHVLEADPSNWEG